MPCSHRTLCSPRRALHSAQAHAVGSVTFAWAAAAAAARRCDIRRTTGAWACQGAACMNNTFCLGIFLALVFFKGLAWEFSAETISIIAVEIVIGLVS
jgi:hypothetical protein